MASWRLKIGIRALRWVFLTLYLVILAGLGALAYSGNIHGYSMLFFLFDIEATALTVGLVLVATLASQLLFVFGAGTADLCRPVGKPRLFVPILTALALLLLLSYAVVVSLLEVLYLDEVEGFDRLLVLWLPLLALWGIWAVVFGFLSSGVEKYLAIRKMTASVFAGSLLSLMVSIPSHLVTSKRPGCLAGASTALGMEIGLVVLLWSFGPGILLMFLKEIRIRQLRRLKNHGGHK